ncbi:MAG: NIPSNAP family protein [Candidatus Lambdaproteobacteria bacterium]|nr:NIPSNAP family protein [Candidatus Lambdaproteobacteria bacterium]
MFYEVRTYTVKPRSIPEVLKRYAEAYEHRKQYSKLAAFWTTEFGPLNQIIHVWPYQDHEERTRIRAEATKNPNWPPKIAEFLVHTQSEIMLQFPFSPELKPATLGPYYEMRTYTLRPRALPIMEKNWGPALPARLKYSPLAAVWYTDFGGLNKFIHVWPYKTLEERNRVREQTRKDKVWPPSQVTPLPPGEPDLIVHQENKIVIPAPFSPMQ